MPVAAIYTRISSDPLDLRGGVERQLADCRALASARFPHLPQRVYEDNDRSAYSGARRPAYERMCADIESGEVAAVVAWDQDRLLRLPRELEALIELCDRAGLRDLLTASGELDLTTHEGQFRARILAAVAKKSSDDTSRRARRQKADARARGLYLGGPVPFGAELVDGRLHPHPQEHRMLAQAARSVLAGATLSSIARGHSSTPRAPHTAAGWRHLLMHSATLAAKEPTLAADVRSFLTSRNRPRGITARREWLSGLVVCARCLELDLSPAEMRLTSAASPSWSCVARSRIEGGERIRGFHLSMKHSILEPIVATALFVAAQVQLPPERDEAPGPPPPPEDVAERLEHLAALYAAGEITAEEWTAARRATLPPSPAPARRAAPPPPVELESVWDRWDPTQRHRAASALLHCVEVLPLGHGKYHQASPLDRLVFRWRV